MNAAIRKVILSLFAFCFQLHAQYWQELDVPRTPILHVLKAVDSRVVWAVGDSAVIIRSTDGGTSWLQIESPVQIDSLTSGDIISFDAVDHLRAWALFWKYGASRFSIYHTENGGLSWSEQFSTEDFLNAIRMVSPDSGYAAGDWDGTGNYVLRTTDGGRNWERLPNVMSTKGSLYGLIGKFDAFGPYVWYPEWYLREIIHSSDFGNTWRSDTVGLPFIQIKVGGISFADGLRGFVLREYSNSLWMTSDGGESWGEVVFEDQSPQVHVRDAFYTCRGSYGIVILSDNYVYLSADEAGTWVKTSVIQYPTAEPSGHTAASFVSPSIGWVAGYHGFDRPTFIAKYTGPPLVTKTVQALDQAPISVFVHQSYPNPFNPSTTIHYELPTRSHVALKVINVLGEEVATLVDEEKEAGSYEVKWDAAGMASGVYFYRLQTEEFTQTRKLVIVR